TSPSPRSHRSSSISSISSTASSLHLDPKTQLLLDSFWLEEAERERQFRELEDAAAAAAHEDEAAEGDGEGEKLTEEDEEREEKEAMSVDTFRELFQEDWQISQFCRMNSAAGSSRPLSSRYSTPFATQLAKFVTSSLPTPTSSVAFLCCPTGFVAFQHASAPARRKHTKLLEYDTRFALVAGRSFVRYDLDEPDVWPEELRGNVEVAVVDPPFLNEESGENAEADPSSYERATHPSDFHFRGASPPFYIFLPTPRSIAAVEV
ncbi:EEF1A lysine methyltransferase 1, partial [Phenoliferia sp. Uapishka_3]